MEHSQKHDHHTMVKDYQKRFLISALVTLPILLLSAMIQEFLGLREILAFKGDVYLLAFLSSFLYFYGGKPFFLRIFY